MAHPAESFPPRLCIALLLNMGLFIFGLDRMARYSTYEAQVWTRFCLAGTSAVSIFLVWPVLRWGGLWPRVGAVLLCTLPCCVLGWVVVDCVR
jgi:hypothetical protein